jgi:hypothetical protein
MVKNTCKSIVENVACIILLAYSSFATANPPTPIDSSQSQVNISRRELSGCGVATLARDVAIRGDYDHPTLTGLYYGFAGSVAYEYAMSSDNKTSHEHRLDAEQAMIGAALCMSIAKGMSVSLKPNKMILIDGKF